ncbi:MAG: hypothetical protein HYX75_21280 [Acidobacteria bacterium]|nr:hypothetical protein [Acidobacteriota bacterium]
MVVCDVCNKGIESSEGYALTTEQVAARDSYWTFMLEGHPSFDDELLAMYVQQQAAQVSGWLVCEACSAHFNFDRFRAKEWARRRVDPPGSGAVAVSTVAAAAARAWKSKHGRWPNWVR